MAKNRYVNTNFWSDTYIETLDPSEKLLFLYFLTNDHTDLSGVYELSARRIAVETGFEKETVLRMIQKFTRDGKVYFFDQKWIYIKNFTRHQKINPSIQSGIERSLANIPKKLAEQIRALDTQPVTASDSLSQSGTLYSTLPNLTLPNSSRGGSPAAPPPTPSEQANRFFSERDLQCELIKKITLAGMPLMTAQQEVNAFVSYWTELNKSGTKQRWQLQPTFEVRRRLVTWLNRSRMHTKLKQNKGITIWAKVWSLQALPGDSRIRKCVMNTSAVTSRSTPKNVGGSVKNIYYEKLSAGLERITN